MVSTVASFSSDALTIEGRKGQSTVMTTSFIRERIDMGLDDIMLELSKQLADIVKPMVHNEIQVAQQQANIKDNSTVAAPWVNIANGNTSANHPGGNQPNSRISNMAK